MKQIVLTIGAIYGLLAVILGAFGAMLSRNYCRPINLLVSIPEFVTKCITPYFY